MLHRLLIQMLYMQNIKVSMFLINKIIIDLKEFSVFFRIILDFLFFLIPILKIK